MQVYVDGQFVPAEDARISVFDHGFLYGDGIFEGIRVYDLPIRSINSPYSAFQAAGRD